MFYGHNLIHLLFYYISPSSNYTHVQFLERVTNRESSFNNNNNNNKGNNLLERKMTSNKRRNEKDEGNWQKNKDVIKVGESYEEEEEEGITRINWKDFEVCCLIAIIDEMNKEFTNQQTNKIKISKRESIFLQKYCDEGG